MIGLLLSPVDQSQISGNRVRQSDTVVMGGSDKYTAKQIFSPLGHVADVAVRSLCKHLQCFYRERSIYYRALFVCWLLLS